MPRDSADRITPHFLDRIHDLTEQQQLWLCCFLSQLVNGERTAALIEQARHPACCPHCQHSGIHRYGISNDLQRYRCLECKRTFNALTGTPLARLRHKTRWLQYCQCLLDPACTIKSAAENTGVHRNTSFRWRHRFLDWIKRDRPASLHGIVEAEEIRLRESHKGSRRLARPPRARGGPDKSGGKSKDWVNIVAARDRAGQTLDFVAGTGALKASALSRHLLPRLDRDVLLVSASNTAYRAFSRKAGIAHRAVLARQRIRALGHIHVQNVSSYHGRFRQWLLHFRGVATRYLDNYLGWRWAIDLCRLDSAEQLLRAALGVSNGGR